MPGRSRQNRACSLSLVSAVSAGAAGSSTRAARKRAALPLSCPAATAQSGLGTCLARQRDPGLQSSGQPCLSIPLLHGEVSWGGDNKGFPGWFVVLTQKRRND